MTEPRSIAAAQTLSRRGDVAANVEEHVRLARVAAAEGARVLVFPELSLIGYELDLGRELAFTEDDARLAPLLDAAAAGAITLLAGAPVRTAAGLHIAAFIVSPDRSVDLYTKRYLGAFSESDAVNGVLPPPEYSVFVPGERDPLIHFAGHTGAAAICADVFRPAHAAAAAARGANTYFAGSFTIESEVAGAREWLRGTAEKHGMAVAYANHGSAQGGLPGGGRSTIWSQRGEVIAELGPEGAGLVLATEDGQGWRGKPLTS